MENKSEQLNDLLVETLIASIREQGIDTPATVLNVARSYLKDNPPEEELPVSGSHSGVLREILESVPFKNPNA